MPTQINPGLSSTDVTAMTGVSYRELDYWVREGAVAPWVEAKGSGHARQFALRDLSHVRMVRDLRKIGVPMAVLVAAREGLRALVDQPPSLTGFVLLRPDATIKRIDRADDLEGGWLVDTRVRIGSTVAA